MNKNFCFALTAMWMLIGCASTPKAPKEFMGEDGYRYRRTDKLDKVWLAEGFKFHGYEGLLIKDTSVADAVKPKDEKESERLTLLQRSLPKDLSLTLDLEEVFPKVTTSAADLPVEAKVLHLETEILEFSRGSSSLRFGVGFGAGMPFVRVRGRMVDPVANTNVFRFELDETGDWFGSGYSSSRTIQNAATMEVAEDVAAFVGNVARGHEVDYR